MWLLREDRRADCRAEVPSWGKVTATNKFLSHPSKEGLKTDWRTQRMEIGNVVLNRRRNSSQETATPASKEHGSARQELLGSADKRGSPGQPGPSAASPPRPRSPLRTGLGLRLS